MVTRNHGTARETWSRGTVVQDEERAADILPRLATSICETNQEGHHIDLSISQRTIEGAGAPRNDANECLNSCAVPHNWTKNLSAPPSADILPRLARTSSDLRETNQEGHPVLGGPWGAGAGSTGVRESGGGRGMVVDVLFLAVFASGHPTEWSTSGFTSADTIKKVTQCSVGAPHLGAAPARAAPGFVGGGRDLVVDVMFLAVSSASGRPTARSAPRNGPPPRLHQRGYIIVIIEVLLGCPAPRTAALRQDRGSDRPRPRRGVGGADGRWTPPCASRPPPWPKNTPPCLRGER